MLKGAEFPILLRQDTVDSARYGPILAFQEYWGALERTGFVPDDLPDVMNALFCLDVYVGEFCNGGHSQYIGNRWNDIHREVDHAEAGAIKMGLSEYVDLLQNLREWIAANPETAARQNGASVRADDLNAFDRTFFAVNYNETERAEFVARQSPAFQTWFRHVSVTDDQYTPEKRELLWAAYLLEHPQSEILSKSAWQDRVSGIARQFDMPKLRRDARHYNFSRNAVPSNAQFALNMCMAQVYGDGPQSAYVRSPEEGGAQRQSVTIYRDPKRRVAYLEQDGSTFRLRGSAETFLSHLRTVARKLRLAMMPADARQKYKIDEALTFKSSKTFRPGQVLASWQAPTDTSAWLMEHHVPTALAMYHAEPYKLDFASARPAKFAWDRARLECDYATRDGGQTRIEVSGLGVQFTDLDAGSVRFFPAAMLRDQTAYYRSATARMLLIDGS